MRPGARFKSTAKIMYEIVLVDRVRFAVPFSIAAPRIAKMKSFKALMMKAIIRAIDIDFPMFYV